MKTTATHGRALERRLEKQQYEIQQEINLADEKIDRLADYYQKLQADITKTDDMLNRIILKSEQNQYFKKGKAINKVTVQNIKTATMAKDHEQLLKELHEQNEKEMQKLREDFENTYEDITRNGEKKETDITQNFETEIQNTLNLINKLKKTTPTPQMEIDERSPEEIEQIAEMEKKRIASLEARLNEQNQERVSSLMNLKKQLQECLANLEEMEQNHATKMQKLQMELDNIDSQYNEKVRLYNENQKKETHEIQRDLKRATNEVKAKQKSMRHAGTRQKEEIQKVRLESESLATELISVKKREMQRVNEENDAINYGKKLAELNATLTNQENVLMKVRSDNETLKKSIARIAHEKEIAKRKAALNF